MSELVKGLQKQITDLQLSVKQAKEARQAERNLTVRQKVSEELAGLGFDSARIRQATGNLIDADKRVRWDDESQSIVFKDSDGDIDLQTGLKSWAKTDDAKIYLPQPAGGGGKPVPSPPPVSLASAVLAFAGAGIGGVVKPAAGASAQPGALANAVLAYATGGTNRSKGIRS